MPAAIKTNEVEWWFWAVTLVFILSAVVGWVPGYYIVIAISCIQMFYFAYREGLLSFPTQVRIVYFAFTLLGLWVAIRWPLFIVLLIGTIMVTFTGRCFIALVLKLMPWNKDLVPGATCEIGQVEE